MNQYTSATFEIELQSRHLDYVNDNYIYIQEKGRLVTIGKCAMLGTVV